jgi:hypothetical protein
MVWLNLKNGMKKINNTILKVLSKLPSNKNWFFWIVIALIFKSSFFIYKVSFEGNRIPNSNYVESFASYYGDSSSYIEPIENLLKTGSYFDDFRMPGYGWIYYLLRFLFSIKNSLSILAVIQLVLSAISVYALAKIADFIFKNKSYFYLTFLLYAISTFVSLFDYYILTESFCTSALIFSFYFLIKSGKSMNYFLFAGIFLTWSIFLKPIIIPLLFLFSAYIFFKDYYVHRNLSSHAFKSVFIFLIPFFIIDGVWISRNYLIYQKVIPLTKSIYYTSTEESYNASLYRFMNSFGGSIVHWQPGSEITFFKPPPKHIKTKIEVTLPENIYTSKYNYDSLLLIKKMIDSIENFDLKKDMKIDIERGIITKLDVYTQSIRDEKPFLYYISSRFKPLKTFFLHSGTYNLFNKTSIELNKLEWLIKVFYSALYVIVVIGGFIGSTFLFIKGFKNIEFLLLSTVGLYIALVFPIILKMDEFRYFVPGYPFFLLSCAYILVITSKIIFNKLKNA